MFHLSIQTSKITFTLNLTRDFLVDLHSISSISNLLSTVVLDEPRILILSYDVFLIMIVPLLIEEIKKIDVQIYSLGENKDRFFQYFMILIYLNPISGGPPIDVFHGGGRGAAAPREIWLATY